MKILECCTSRSWGGMEMRVIKTSDVLRNRGHHIKILCHTGSSIHKEAEERNLETIPLPFKNSIHLNLIWKLQKIIKKESFDLIHLQFSRDLRFVIPAIENIKPKIPVVLTKRVGSFISKKDLFHKYLYSRVEKITAISEVIKKNIIETCPVNPENVEVIYNGIDLTKFNNSYDDIDIIRENFSSMPDETIIAIIGRITPGKGHEEFLQAAKIISLKYTSVKFWIVGAVSYGEEYYEKKISDLVKKLNLADQIKFIGFQENIPKILSIIDILIVPSHAESFGNIAIEGMASKKPVIASNSEGLLEIIDNNKNGLLFKNKDYKSLADSMELLINDENFRKTLGANGRKKVEEHFEESKQYDKLEKLLLNLAKSNE